MKRLWGILFSLSREGRVLATTLCAVAVLAVDVGRTEAHVPLFAAAALLLSSMLISQRYGMPGAKIEARGPRRVAVGEEALFRVIVRNEGSEPLESVRVEGPRLRWGAVWINPTDTIPTLAPGEQGLAGLKARFDRRGEARLAPFRAAALVPLGLAQGAREQTAPYRVLVVPRPARVQRVTTPQSRRYQPGGVSRASQVGDTSELLGVRPYRPGDAVRDLHARSWARFGVPMVREYQQEYFTRVGVVLDVERSRDGERFEAALSLAAGVISRLCGGETLVDLLVTGEQVHQLTLGRGLGTVDQALDALATVDQGPGFKAEGVLAKLGPFLERLSSVVLIALWWDDERARLAASLRSRGVECTTLVLGRDGASPVGAKVVDIGAIQRGEALVL